MSKDPSEMTPQEFFKAAEEGSLSDEQQDEITVDYSQDGSPENDPRFASKYDPLPPESRIVIPITHEFMDNMMEFEKGADMEFRNAFGLILPFVNLLMLKNYGYVDIVRKSTNQCLGHMVPPSHPEKLKDLASISGVEKIYGIEVGSGIPWKDDR